MRKIAGEKPGTEVLYVPKAYGNRDDTDPMRVWFVVPSNRERRRLVTADDKVEVRRNPDDPDGKPIISTSLSSNVERQEHVVSNTKMRIEKYAVYGIQIEDGPGLAEHGENDILEEMHDLIMSHCDLTEDEQKKSEGSPSSSKPATPPSTKTAPTALSANSR